MTIWKKGKLNSEKIWKKKKKPKLNSEETWKLWKKSKLKSEKTWQIQYGRKTSRIVKKIW
jgi:hypothetical protein